MYMRIVALSFLVCITPFVVQAQEDSQRGEEPIYFYLPSDLPSYLCIDPTSVLCECECDIRNRDATGAVRPGQTNLVGNTVDEYVIEICATELDDADDACGAFNDGYECYTSGNERWRSGTPQRGLLVNCHAP